MDLAFFLLRAHESAFGISILTSNVQLLRNKMYAEKRKWPEFAHIAVLPCPTDPEHKLWLVKKEPKDGAS